MCRFYHFRIRSSVQRSTAQMGRIVQPPSPGDMSIQRSQSGHLPSR